MAHSTTSAATRRELAHRLDDGLDVTLYWHPRTNEVTVLVVDERRQESFEIAAPPQRALDVFRHPFAYGSAPWETELVAA